MPKASAGRRIKPGVAKTTYPNVPVYFTPSSRPSRACVFPPVYFPTNLKKTVTYLLTVTALC